MTGPAARLLVITILFAVGSSSLQSQAYTVSGSIFEEGHAIPGAAITFVAAHGSVTRVIRSDSNGKYNITLQRDEYLVSVVSPSGAGWSELLTVNHDVDHDISVTRDTTKAGQSPQELWSSKFFNLTEPNYFITAFDDVPDSEFTTRYGKQVKFRVALRYRVVSFVDPDHESGAYAAYTQNSFWHLWEPSAPFLDNNYSPYALMYWDGRDRSWLKSLSFRLIPIEHESNGREGPASRAWNRYGAGVDVGYREKSAVFGYVRGWRVYGGIDDNPEILDFNGRGELMFVVQPWFRSHRLGTEDAGLMVKSRVMGQHLIQNSEINVFVGPCLIFRNDWCNRHLAVSLHGQYFYGTGENLLHYTERHSSLRFGLATVR